MTGFKRIIFAGLAATLRGIARVPLGLAQRIEAMADRCERIASGKPPTP